MNVTRSIHVWHTEIDGWAYSFPVGTEGWSCSDNQFRTEAAALQAAYAQARKTDEQLFAQGYNVHPVEVK